MEAHSKKEMGINIGAGSDLQKATRIAYDYICRYGLGERLMVVPESFAAGETGYPEAAVLPESEKEAIWKSVGQLLDREWECTRQQLKEWWGEVEALACALIGQRELDGEEAERVIRGKGI